MRHTGAPSACFKCVCTIVTLGDVQAVGNVGFKSKRGRHTTRSAILLDLPGGGLLVDTPGFNYPSMEKVTTANVASLFPEIRQITETTPCRFSNCTHVHEPDCSVRDVEWDRYKYYVRCDTAHSPEIPCGPTVKVSLYM